MINILYYYYCDVIRVMYHSNSLLTTKNEKSKDYCKADLKQRVLFFVTVRPEEGWYGQPNFCYRKQNTLF